MERIAETAALTFHRLRHLQSRLFESMFTVFCRQCTCLSSLATQTPTFLRFIPLLHYRYPHDSYFTRDGGSLESHI
ncbi:hypothetical protein KIN20_014178 [Parelaphostrongylus tenuis]|uniref:Uncharacterized protein n=1 Tax=Parelaphostrongylus tenuis TaxID=148309 RepID=A0AAD5MGQ6_PARTN|nr:hypothetical protein KIN20_014178 [Parelaphostrongylus tenuis]